MTLQTLSDLGWSPFFQSQLADEDLETLEPLRVSEVHRSAMDAIGVMGPRRVQMNGDLFDHGVAVGDWILAERDSDRPDRVLERRSEIKRRAAGDQPSAQLIAANIDTLFIVSSCNADYNPARIERYLTLAAQAQVDPVVVLTKADLHDDPIKFRETAENDLPNVPIVAIDAKSDDAIEKLASWLGKTQTVALVGSSGVGKTTLTNLLTGRNELTLEIREDDARGRHTTTARSMFPVEGGGWLIDTPGMRALRLYDVSEGVAAVFEDLDTLSHQCKFNDCAHETEPGCAIQAGIAAGTVNAARLGRWQKLQREDIRHSETLTDARKRDRSSSRKIRQVTKAAKHKQELPD